MMWKGQKRRRCQKKCTVLAQESLSLTKRTFSCDLLLNTTSPNNNAHPLLNIPARKTSVFFGSLHVHLPQLNSAQRPRKDLSDGTGRWRNLSLFEPIWANFWTKLVLTKSLWAKLLGCRVRFNFDSSLGRPQLEERVNQQGVEFTLCHSLEKNFQKL